jgi:hypothetical protein
MFGWKYDVINLQKFLYFALHLQYYVISKDKDNLLLVFSEGTMKL